MKTPSFSREKCVNWFKRNGRYLYLLALEVYSQFISKNCQRSAAALTYVSLFSLVPMLTVVYAMLSIIPSLQGMEDQIQAFIFQNLVPSSGLALQEYLNDFTEKARGLTLPGVTILIVTAYLMLKNIERTFNNIWGVTRSRSGVASFLLYWAVLSLGPLLMGAGLAMSTYLISKKLLVDEYDPIGVLPIILQYLPWLLSTGVFTLFYAAVPNCRVTARDAIIGGVTTAFCFEIAKDVFGALVAKTSYQLIYGAFAIVPLFLLWVYVLWVIVLSGAVLVRSLSHVRADINSRGYSDFVAAVFILHKLHKAQDHGMSIKEKHIVRLGIFPEQWYRIRRSLLSARVIAETQGDGYIVSRNLEHYSLESLYNVVGDYHLAPAGLSSGVRNWPWAKSYFERLRQGDQYVESLLKVSLAELFRGQPDGIEVDESLDSTHTPADQHQFVPQKDEA
ncbi:YihY family inner membrane protein [Sessilibacter sp. MAH2]